MVHNLSPAFYKEEILKDLSKSELESNSIFLFLKSELEKNLNSSTKLSSLSINLHRLLREVIFTKDLNLQFELLKKIKNWYDSKTSPNKIDAKVSLTPNPEPLKNPTIFVEKKISPAISPYLPKKYKKTPQKTVHNVERKDSLLSNSSNNTRPSTSEPIKRTPIRRLSQSPNIIRLIIDNFVKNKRIKMYNFSMDQFLEDSRKNGTDSDMLHEKKQHRPMSCSMKKQIEEVENVKHRLANRRVSCRIQSIFHGIVIDDFQREWTTNLPKGGEFLIKARRL